MALMTEIGISILLIIGGVFALVGAIGLARLPDFYTRLHGPTKATTIGVGSIALASFFYFAGANASYDLIELLIMIFLFLTAPISANFLAKAAMHLKVKTTDNTRGQPWDQ